VIGTSQNNLERSASDLERAAVLKELEEARSSFGDLLGRASPAGLRRRSNGTRWTNRQLLFHMLFGYLIVRTLLPLVRFLGRRPPEWSRRFAATLNAGRRPFHLINFLGSWGGGKVLPVAALIKLMDRTVRALQHNLSVETEQGLALTMHFPTSWDPYFRDTMSVFDIYHYGTQHFDHHRKQLSL
jgi:DinB superfamily